VRLDAVVLVGMLDCSGMVPGRRIEGTTGGRSSVLVWAAAALQSKGGRRTWSRATGRGKQQGARGIGALVFIGSGGAEVVQEGEETSAINGHGDDGRS
jgi:hypothetical protein